MPTQSTKEMYIYNRSVLFTGFFFLWGDNNQQQFSLCTRQSNVEKNSRPRVNGKWVEKKMTTFLNVETTLSM